jgi:RNA polymerase sigma-70 factor (ECF subfamily)
MSSKCPSAFDLSLPSDAVLDNDAAAERARLEVLLHFDESGAALRRYVRSFGLSADAAEDVLQEVFLSLFRHLCLDRPRTNLRGWLFRVAHNLSLRQRRTLKRRDGETALDETVINRLIDASDNPEERMTADQRRLRLRALLQAMPERDRRCLYLRAEGLPYRDIAKAVGISLGSVAKSLARSLTRVTNAEVG